MWAPGISAGTNTCVGVASPGPRDSRRRAAAGDASSRDDRSLEEAAPVGPSARQEQGPLTARQLILLVILAYALMSVVAFAVYGIDKQRAVRGQWRTREATLQLIALFGGWPGAWLAQRVFRHKTSKSSFMIVFWAIVALHVCAWAWWFRSSY